MAYGFYRFSLEDFDRWKAAFDADGVNRGRASSKGGFIFRNRANPNEVIVLLEYADAAQMEAFSRSPELRAAMGHAGMIGPPDVAFLELVARPDV
jgi:hypothetical protein